MDDPAAPVALDELLAHRAWVRSLALALTGDEHDAADVEQATWLAAIRTPPAHRGSLRGWLATTVRHSVSRLRRGERRRSAYETAAHPKDDAEDAAELAGRADAHRRVVEALVALDEPYRRALLLRYFEGLSVAEVAERTGAPLETCRARLRRGLAKLRASLEKDFGGRGALGIALVSLGGREGGAAGTAAAGGVAMAGMKAAVIAGVCVVAAGVWWLWPARTAPPAAVGRNGTPSVDAPSPGARAAPPRAVPENAVVEKPIAATQDTPTLPPTARTFAEKLAAPAGTFELSYVTLKEAFAALSLRTDVEFRVTAEVGYALGGRKFDFASEGQSVRETIAFLLTGRTIVPTVREDHVVLHGPEDDLALEELFPIPRAQPRAEVTVRLLVTGPDERPVPGAEIRDENGAVLGRSGADGALSLRRRPPVGIVYATHGEHAPSVLRDVVSTEGAETRLALRPAARVTGRVLGPNGPVASARVTIAATSRPGAVEPPLAPTTTDASGAFRVAGVPGGTVRVVVSAPKHGPRLESVVTGAGTETSIDVVLTPEAFVTGVVRDSDGAPVAGARVGAQPLGGLLPSISATSDVTGAFVMGGLPAGDVVLSAGAEGLNVSPGAKVTLAAGEKRTWDPVLRKPPAAPR